VISPTVGILGYQGCIEPHEAIFERLGVTSVRVRTPSDLALVDRLIIPGGESTTMLRFIKLHNMIEPLRQFAEHHRVWGICAGAILVASEVTHPSQESLKLIDIAAHRNFYGSQLDSFTTQLEIDICKTPVEAQFIRAPLLAPLAAPVADATRTTSALHVHAYHEGQPVFFSQGTVWACSFHVELGSDLTLHQAFVA
jgi:5'-phosphate synthase pdxT subunit